MAYDNFGQLQKLIRALDDERNAIFIHIDKKSKSFNNQIKNILIHTPKYSIVRIYNDIKVYWSHYSQIECEIFLIKKALQYGSFEYYHLLSGQDFPIKSQNYIHDFFDKNLGKEFIDYQENFYNQNRDLIENRIKYFHLFRKYCRYWNNVHINRFFRMLDILFIIPQKLFKINRIEKNKLDICFGANWFSITENFAKYLASKEIYINRNFKYTNCADEIFIQSILKKSPYFKNLYKKTTYDFYGNMRLVDFKRGNPYTWVNSDLSEIIASKYLFIRKVDDRVDNVLIENLMKF